MGAGCGSMIQEAQVISFLELHVTPAPAGDSVFLGVPENSRRGQKLVVDPHGLVSPAIMSGPADILRVWEPLALRSKVLSSVFLDPNCTPNFYHQQGLSE
jgi:hypothetical protein